MNGVVVEASGVESLHAQVDVGHAVRLDQPARLVVGLLVPVGAHRGKGHEAEPRTVAFRRAQEALEGHQGARLSHAPRIRGLVREKQILLFASERLVVREETAEDQLLHAVARRIARPKG